MIAARRPSAGGADASLLLVTAFQDVVTASVLIAPNDDGQDWGATWPRWAGAVGPASAPDPVDGLIGTAALLFGELPSAVVRAADNPADPTMSDTIIAQGMVGRLPHFGAAPGTEWTKAAPVRAGAGGRLRVWELPYPPARSAHHRLLLVLAGQTADAEAQADADLSYWVWQGNSAGNPPATRYLLDAARLRHQYALLRRELPALELLTRRVNEACDELPASLRSPEAAPPSVADLTHAERKLTGLRIDRGGVVLALQRLSVLDAALLGCEQNLERSGTAGVGIADPELRAARWARQQLAVTRISLAAATERSAEAVTNISSAVDRSQSDRRDRISLIQTSFIGALLMALTAAQSLGYEAPVPGPVQPAMVAFFAAMALTVPTLLIPRADAATLLPRRRVADTALSLAGGAAAGWLISTIIVFVASHRPAPPTLTIICAAGGALVAALAVAGRRVLLARRA